MKTSLLLTALAALVLSGCASRSAEPLAESVRVPSSTFFVENHGKDKRGLEVLIASEMSRRSLRVSSGRRAERPQDATHLVTYVDRWSWDMRTYLAELRIQVRDLSNGKLVAESRIDQDSLAAMGRSFEETVERATGQLFEGVP